MTMIEYDPYASAVQHNPYPVWKELRDRAPVYHNPEYGFYALSRYDDVLGAFLDPTTYISGEGTTIDGSDRGSHFLIGMDPPEHTVYRKFLARAFTPRRIAELEPFVRRICVQYLDELRGRDRFDVVQDFSLRLPLDVIGELIGIPAELRDTVHELSNRAAFRSADRDRADALEDVIAAMVEMREMYLGLVVERRKRPRDDVMSMLLAAEVTDDDGKPQPLSDEIIAAQFNLLAAAGHETVMKLIGNGAVALWWNPDQRAELVENPALIPGAVEEMIRWDNPAPIEGRWSTRDVELHGTVIPANSRVILLMGSGNHDERQYSDPELFDIHRTIERPLGFGFGIHLCLGASLARLEARVAFEELLARYPRYEIEESGVVRGPASFFRGLANLPVVPGT